MRFDELTDNQRDQAQARFGATPLTGNDVRDAAPDLLAVLENTIQAIQRQRTAGDNYNRLGGNFPSDEDDDNREFEAAYDEYEAAIANLIHAEHDAMTLIVRVKGGAL